MILVSPCHALKKEAVARHREIDASTGENEPVVTAERRNHDSRGHGQRAWLSEHAIHHRDCYTILWCVFDRIKWQNRDVGQVCKHIQDHRDTAAIEERPSEIATGIANFAS